MQEEGRRTTTALTGEIMANYFADTKVVGNIGIPYTSVALDTKDETVIKAIPVDRIQTDN